ncbi:MAG: hypothetical protein ACKOX6_07855 [Bdellovibrio sp.]
MNKFKSIQFALITLMTFSTSTMVQAASGKDYEEVSYEDLVGELSRKKDSLTQSQNSANAPKTHIGIGYANSFSNISANGQNFNRYSSGVQLSYGMDMGSPRWYTDLPIWAGPAAEWRPRPTHHTHAPYTRPPNDNDGSTRRPPSHRPVPAHADGPGAGDRPGASGPAAGRDAHTRLEPAAEHRDRAHEDTHDRAAAPNSRGGASDTAASSGTPCTPG